MIEGSKPDFKHLYEVEAPIAQKIETIVKEIYGGDGVVFSAKAQKEIKKLEDIGLDKLPDLYGKDTVFLV